MNDGDGTVDPGEKVEVTLTAVDDLGMDVDVASPAGGEIPVDPMSVRAVLRTEADDRMLDDDDLRGKIENSKSSSATGSHVVTKCDANTGMPLHATTEAKPQF